LLLLQLLLLLYAFVVAIAAALVAALQPEATTGGLAAQPDCGLLRLQSIATQL